MLDYNKVNQILGDARVGSRSPVSPYDFWTDIAPLFQKRTQEGVSQMGAVSPDTTSAVGGQTQTPSMGVAKDNKELYSLIQRYFPQNEWENAYRVALGESGGRPDAVGDNYPIKGQTIPSYGYFQIRGLPGRPDPKILVDPEQNVRYAAELWKSQGWQPWTVARNLGLSGTTPIK